jgi:hypothetical protein
VGLPVPIPSHGRSRVGGDRGRSFQCLSGRGGAGADESEQVEAVDFDLVGPDCEVLLAAQVKTGGSTASLGTGVVYRIMKGLVTRCDAERYELLTNVRLAAGAGKVADLLARPNHSVGERRVALARSLSEARSSADVSELTDDQVERLGRCRVLVDPRDRTDVADSVKTQVWDFRRKRGRCRAAVLRSAVGTPAGRGSPQGRLRRARGVDEG